jgi:putative endonuclease
MYRTGLEGEELAARYLENAGFRILDRNYRFERAEIDIICFEPAVPYDLGGEIVFVEVKTRRGLRFGRPEEAVDAEKRNHLFRAAEAYLYERKLEGSPCRFDVIAVRLDFSPPTIEHFRDAFFRT